MATYIRQLTDNAGNNILPATRAEGVYFHDTPPKNNEYDRYSPWYPSVKPYKFDIDNNKYFRDARYAYAYLIDKISGSGTWKSNPMVMVYDFELID